MKTMNMAAPLPRSPLIQLCYVRLAVRQPQPVAAFATDVLGLQPVPAKQALLAKKEDLEQKIDALKYQKAAMDPADYKQQLTAALVELAQVQQELDK